MAATFPSPDSPDRSRGVLHEDAVASCPAANPNEDQHLVSCVDEIFDVDLVTGPRRKPVPPHFDETVNTSVFRLLHSGASRHETHGEVIREDIRKGGQGCLARTLIVCKELDHIDAGRVGEPDEVNVLLRHRSIPQAAIPS